MTANHPRICLTLLLRKYWINLRLILLKCKSSVWGFCVGWIISSNIIFHIAVYWFEAPTCVGLVGVSFLLRQVSKSFRCIFRFRSFVYSFSTAVTLYVTRGSFLFEAQMSDSAKTYPKFRPRITNFLSLLSFPQWHLTFNKQSFIAHL